MNIKVKVKTQKSNSTKAREATKKVPAFRILCDKYYYVKRLRKVCPNCKNQVGSDEFQKVRVSASRFAPAKKTKPGVQTFSTKKTRKAAKKKS